MYVLLNRKLGFAARKRSAQSHASDGRVEMLTPDHDDWVEKLARIDRKKLGRNVAKLRYRMDFSQEELAERAAIEPRYLQKIESGEFGGSLAVLKRIKRELKTEWNRLLEGL